MPIQHRKATTNGQRGMSFVDLSGISREKPKIKKLLTRGKKITGRAGGTISVRHRGGGTRPQYRKIDFSSADKMDIPAKVKSIEYDPNRTSFIALLCYADGEYRYTLAHKTMKVGDEVICQKSPKIKDGNRMPLESVPVGFLVHNLEMIPGKGGQMVRSAGSSAKLVSLDGEKAQVELKSGEIRLFEKSCLATLGVVSNEEQNQIRVGKAGRVRHRGRRPQVRGKAMNPCDHPHGGGEAGNSIGMKYPKTPWGAHALGVKTRKNKKLSNKLIVRSRHRAKK